MAKTFVNIGFETGTGGGGGGVAVDSVNGKTGAVSIVAGTNVTVNNAGSSIVISATGGGGGGGSGNTYFPGGW